MKLPSYYILITIAREGVVIQIHTEISAENRLRTARNMLRRITSTAQVENFWGGGVLTFARFSYRISSTENPRSMSADFGGQERNR
jgi:hypothetical protein